ncbi:unnamed protein product, partial [Laminaria digitata]
SGPIRVERFSRNRPISRDQGRFARKGAGRGRFAPKGTVESRTEHGRFTRTGTTEGGRSCPKGTTGGGGGQTEAQDLHFPGDAIHREGPLRSGQQGFEALVPPEGELG